MELREAKQQVINAGRELAQSGLIARTWGNISCRTGKDTFVITASGRDYMKLTEDEIVEVNISDLKYKGKVKPSSERKVHAALYKFRPEAQFIIHTHQNNASAVSATGLSEVVLNREYEGFGRSVPCAEYALPGTTNLSKFVAETAMASPAKAVIMKHHGAVCFGSDFKETFKIACDLETACARFLKLIGVPYWAYGSEGNLSYSFINESSMIRDFAEDHSILRAYLDDFAQLVGRKLVVTNNEESIIKTAISKNQPLIIRGEGALCAAENPDDSEALSMVIEKNCRACLAAEAAGQIAFDDSEYINFKKGAPLKPWDVALMRQFYLKKYSKLKK